ncbi:hypothetical protein PILCRDRAFT_811881 [Piloderma croceum F 1598]|uniref:Uncharacterized protein n=1 Tax=Piloderma croceum (strain F 1598) TaxID=765440 RepID=A0A0C3GEN8_PILCF|nr:hypothetical protein PILCRDRAFT_811881 [Piloderma croceum F 1598]
MPIYHAICFSTATNIYIPAIYFLFFSSLAFHLRMPPSILHTTASHPHTPHGQLYLLLLDSQSQTRDEPTYI